MTHTTSADIPHLVKILRQRLGRSQTKFAKHLGISFQTVNGWENGHYRPSPMAMKLIRDEIEKMGDEANELLKLIQQH